MPCNITSLFLSDHCCSYLWVYGCSCTLALTPVRSNMVQGRQVSRLSLNLNDFTIACSHQCLGPAPGPGWCMLSSSFLNAVHLFCILSFGLSVFSVCTRVQLYYLSHSRSTLSMVARWPICNEVLQVQDPWAKLELHLL